MSVKYYKVMWPNSSFSDVYKSTDLNNIAPNTIISAPDKPYNYSDGTHIENPTQVIHFCDNAFDTMLWYNMLDAFCVYEIEPLTPVIKQKCKESQDIYQCGAQKIKIVKKIPTDTMFDLALSEFEQDREAKIRMYMSISMPKVVHYWLRHQKAPSINR